MTTDARPRELESIAPEDEDPCFAGSAPESIEWLIDNADAYGCLVDALGTARRSIRIAQLALDVDCIAYTDEGNTTQTASPCSTGNILVQTLTAVAARRDVEVSVLLNATLLLDTSRPLRRFLESAGARGIQLRGTSRFPQLLHAKIVIIDGTDAFLVGSPFVNGYWDDRRHHPVDARRPSRELGGRPLHDVSLRVTGPVVADLEALFCEMWNQATVIVGDRRETLQPDRAGASMPTHTGALRLVRTVPRGGLPSMPDGATEILDACLDGIGRARSLIYIEHQYLSARPVVAALAAALQRVPALQVIAVLNQNPDITAYRAWQNARLAEWGLLGHPRMGVFALWSAEPDAGADRVAVNQVFVHSKVLAVDDRWGTIGSANLDGVSLHSYGDDFHGWLGRRLFRAVRNFDANIVVEDSIDDVVPLGTVADLRMRLWSEHLGLSRDEVATVPSGGWLPLWRRRAGENVAALNAERRAAGGPLRMRGFVLPYSARATPAEQLADIGVHVHSAGLDLRFDPGWVEVRFSPNWVRNMFV